jgi:predicted ATP-dependent serine protease
MTNKNLNYFLLNEIADEPVMRLPTGVHEIDYMYGLTTQGKKWIWGLPLGKLSVWCAPGGTGKSRALVEVAKSVSNSCPRGGGSYTVLYFQGEMPLPEFRSRVVMGGLPFNSKNFILSEATKLSEQIAIIEELHCQGRGPNLIIVDSINMVEEYLKGRESGVDAVILGTEGQKGYKQVAMKVGAHVIFVSQVTKSGEMRGSSSFQHLVNAEFFVEKIKSLDDDKFVITCPLKNRDGKTGTEVVWQHKDDCAVCISENRLKDDRWKKTVGGPILISTSNQAEPMHTTGEMPKFKKPSAWRSIFTSGLRNLSQS